MLFATAGLFALAGVASAHYAPRQVVSASRTSTNRPSSSSSSGAASTPAPSAGGGPQPSLSFASTGPSAIPIGQITAGAPTQTTNALHPTLVPTPGATPPIAGAPALPSWSFTPGSFPALDLVPDTNSPQVQAWIAEVRNSGVTIPSFAPTVDGASCAGNAAAAADASRCWWTCGACTRSTDITTCPNKLTWGVSFDDGPSEYTPDLLNFMDDNQLKSTFFIVGSRAISRPQTLQAEYMAGHQLSVHTWSHTALTTLTNDQITAELGWTREAIRQITGVSPNTMRPPYGDIDDRVRAISLGLGMTPIIWTTAGGKNFDTNDWHIPSGETPQNVAATFAGILGTAASLDTGFIVLAHDLYQQTVDLATGYILPDALARRNPQFNLMSIVQCQNKPLANAYVETNNNQTNPFSSNAQAATGTGAVVATPAGISQSRGPITPGATDAAGNVGSSGATGVQVGTILAVVVGVVVGGAMVVM